ncbi:hypothetical protein [Sinomicrobium sp.]
MEAIAHREPEDYIAAFKERMEVFKSSGKLHTYPVFSECFYYSEGVQYVMSFLNSGKMFLEKVINASRSLKEESFVTIRLYRQTEEINALEFCKRNGEVLKKEWISGTIPVEKGLCLCFYLIGRTLILPVEY